MSLKVNIEKYFKPDVYLSDVVRTSSTAGLLKNDGTVDTNTYAQTSQLPSVATSSVVGLVKPDGSSITVDANGVLTAVGGGTSDPYDGKKVRYTISSSNWSSSPNSDGYYTYSLTLTNPLTTNTSPNVYIAGSTDSTQPTATENTMFSYVKRCNLSSSTTLVLYADTKPTSTFYVFVGAEGGASGLVYSTTEHVVGTWDGATLYEKDISTTFGPQSGENDKLFAMFDLSPLGIDGTKIKDIVFHPVLADSTASSGLRLPRFMAVKYSSATSFAVVIDANSDTPGLDYMTYYNGKTCRVTLRYTKS